MAFTDYETEQLGRFEIAARIKNALVKLRASSIPQVNCAKKKDA